MSKVYSYNDVNYTPILTLQKSIKFICEKWLLTSSVLYEFIDLKRDIWIGHSISWKESHIRSQIGYRKGPFIYFIENTEKLMRIDK